MTGEVLLSNVEDARFRGDVDSDAPGGHFDASGWLVRLLEFLGDALNALPDAVAHWPHFH